LHITIAPFPFSDSSNRWKLILALLVRIQIRGFFWKLRSLAFASFQRVTVLGADATVLILIIYKSVSEYSVEKETKNL